jgi:hypothetical protein
LSHVEHEQLRKKWNEQSLHSCVVCASASCPNLRKEAFVGNKVAAQMEDQMKQWMKNDSKGLASSGLLGESQTLTLSRIFLWFGDDFGGSKRTQQWLPQCIEDAAVKDAIANDVKVRFSECDWNIDRATKQTKSDVLIFVEHPQHLHFNPKIKEATKKNGKVRFRGMELEH